jgi:hypothetical protein
MVMTMALYLSPTFEWMSIDIKYLSPDNQSLSP